LQNPLQGITCHAPLTMQITASQQARGFGSPLLLSPPPPSKSKIGITFLWQEKIPEKERKATWIGRLVENIHYKHVTDAFTTVFRPRPHSKGRSSHNSILPSTISQKIHNELCQNFNHFLIMLSVEGKMAVKTARWHVQISKKIFGLTKIALAFISFNFLL
jgi:hypothetical protein